MNSRGAASDDSIRNIDMAGEQSSIGKNAIVSHGAVVPCVGIRHPIVVIADASGLVHLGTRDRHSFAQDIVRSNDDSMTDEIRRRSQILRSAADARVGIDDVALTHRQRTFQLHSRAQNRS